jgi:hypothetical protein
MLYIDKYKPQRVEDPHLVGCKREYETLRKWLVNWKVGKGHMILEGGAGSGKTLLSEILMNMNTGYQCLRINTEKLQAAKDMKDDIFNFCSSYSRSMSSLIYGPKNKLLILEEDVDEKMSDILMKKSGIPVLKICASSNYKKGIDSLYESVYINRAPVESISKLLRLISKEEGREIVDKDANVIAYACNGDIRNAINILQFGIKDGKGAKDNFASDSIYECVAKLCGKGGSCNMKWEDLGKECDMMEQRYGRNCSRMIIENLGNFEFDTIGDDQKKKKKDKLGIMDKICESGSFWDRCGYGHDGDELEEMVYIMRRNGSRLVNRLCSSTSSSSTSTSSSKILELHQSDKPPDKKKRKKSGIEEEAIKEAMKKRDCY